MRITKNDLDNVVQRINVVTGRPPTSYSKQDDGSYIPNAGNYHLDWDYGGVSLAQMSLTEGCTGTRDIISGKGTKSELYYKMHAFLAGIEAAR